MDALEKETVVYDGQEIPIYDATQRQRAMERDIRKTKRELSAYNAAMGETDEATAGALKEQFTASSVKLKHQEASLREFERQTGLLHQGDRTQAHGFGRSEAQKAVWANKSNAARIERFRNIRYDSYMDASRGGRNHGTYVTLSGQTDSQLLRSVRSYRNNIDEHHEKINNPAQYVDDWENRNDTYKAGIIKKWQKDIIRNEEQLNVARGIAIERGLKDE